MTRFCFFVLIVVLAFFREEGLAQNQKPTGTDKATVFVLDGLYVSRSWIRRSSPPPDWAKIERYVWLEYYFPDLEAAIVRPIGFGLPLAETQDYAYCFKVEKGRYTREGFFVGDANRHHGEPYMTVTAKPIADIEVTAEREQQLRKIIAKHSEKTPSIEVHLFQRITNEVPNKITGPSPGQR